MRSVDYNGPGKSSRITYEIKLCCKTIEKFANLEVSRKEFVFLIIIVKKICL